MINEYKALIACIIFGMYCTLTKIQWFQLFTITYAMHMCVSEPLPIGLSATNVYKVPERNHCILFLWMKCILLCCDQNFDISKVHNWSNHRIFFCVEPQITLWLAIINNAQSILNKTCYSRWFSENVSMSNCHHEFTVETDALLDASTMYTSLIHTIQCLPTLRTCRMLLCVSVKLSTTHGELSKWALLWS